MRRGASTFMFLSRGVHAHTHAHTHINMHTYTHTRAYSLTCAGGIYADTHGSVHQNLPTYTHLRPLLDHPIWRLEASQKTTHLQRQREGETQGGRRGEEWAGVLEEEGRAPHIRKRNGGGRQGEGDLWCVVMPQLPICFFRHLFILIGHSVLSSVDSVVPSLLPNNGPITGWDCHCLTVLSTLGCFGRLFPLRLCGYAKAPLMSLVVLRFEVESVVQHLKIWLWLRVQSLSEEVYSRAVI